MNGARIGITAARRAEEQASLVRSLGGVPVLGAALHADTPRSDEVLSGAVDAMLSEPADVVVFLTGVGAGVLFDAAARMGHEDRFRAFLSAATVVGRGTKPRRTLRRLGIEPDRVIDPPVTTAVRDALVPDAAGKRIVVQGFGPEPLELIEPLRAAGADVLHVSPYASTMPDDPEPAAHLARSAASGELAALTFTSVQAARQFLEIAESAGVPVEALRDAATLIVAVGPVTRQALQDEGLPVDVEPETPRMGAMYQALASRLTSRG